MWLYGANSLKLLFCFWSFYAVRCFCARQAAIADEKIK